MGKKSKNPYAGLNALERSSLKLRRAVAAKREAERALKEARAEYQAALKLARKYVPPGTLSVKKGFSVKKTPTKAQIKKVKKIADAVLALKSRPHFEFKSRSKKRMEAVQEFSGHPKGVKLTRAFVPTLSPQQKAKLEFDKAGRPQLIDLDTGARTAYVPTPDIVEYTDDDGNVDTENLVAYVENQIEEYAPASRYALIQNGEHQVWAQGADRESIGHQMAYLMRKYGADKFDASDKSSHYFGNWMIGVRGYTTRQAYDIFREDRRQRMIAVGGKKNRARMKGRL